MAMELGDSQTIKHVSDQDDTSSTINRPVDVFSLLQEHLPLESDDSSTEEEAFSCSRCRLLYVDPEVGRLHELSEDCERHWPGHQCSVCGLGFEDFQLRVQHETEDHDFQNAMTQTPTCTICEADCGSLDAVTPHMRELHYQAELGTFNDSVDATDGIDDSGAAFEASNNIDQAKSGQQEEFVLSLEEKTVSASNPEKHANDHGKQANECGETNCSSCCKKFATNLSYLQHMYTKHDYPYCRPCGESFKCKDDLHQHMKLKHKCFLCEKEFAQHADLSKHMQAEHGRSKPAKAGVIGSRSEIPPKERKVSLPSSTGWFRCFICHAESGSVKGQPEKVESFHDACPLCIKAFPKHLDLGKPVKSRPTEQAPSGSKNSPGAVSKTLLRGIDWTALQTRGKCSEIQSENFVCRRCGCGFPEKTAFLQHEKAKHGASVCFLCEETFSDQRGMLQHFNLQHNVPVCLECELKFTNSTSFQQHMAKEHSVKLSEATLASPLSSSVKTNTPDVVSKASKSLTKHVPVHYCATCDRTFVNEQTLEQHKKNKHASVQNCSTCDREFRNEKALEHHNKDKHASDFFLPFHDYTTECTTEYSCYLCGRDFVNEQTLQEHNRNKHAFDFPALNDDTTASATEYTCHLCDRDFVNGQALEQHNKDKHAPVHYCATCDRVFVNEQALEQHNKDKHAPVHYCATCDRVFVNEQALEQHNKDKHAPVPYCAACDREFVNEQALEQHNRDKHDDRYSTTDESTTESESTESTGSEYTCYLCDREFSNERALEQHNRDKHGAWFPSATYESTTESESSEGSEYSFYQKYMSFGCRLCNKDFSNKRALEQHNLDKHGFEHYCNSCDREFVNEQALGQHQRDKHGY